jgi:hypothetical protein
LCHVVGCGGGRADSPSPNTRLERGRSGGVGEGGDGSAGWWGRGDTTSVSLAAGGGGSSRVGEFGDASRAAGLAVVWAPAPAMARPREFGAVAVAGGSGGRYVGWGVERAKEIHHGHGERGGAMCGGRRGVLGGVAGGLG